MLHIGRAQCFSPDQLSVEFVNVGGWLTYGDLALDFLWSVPCCS